MTTEMTPQKHPGWPMFWAWAEANGAASHAEEDWRPHWECWLAGYEVALVQAIAQMREDTADDSAIVSGSKPTAKRVIRSSFEDMLRALLNAESQENECDTPDYVLSHYLIGCLNAFRDAVKSRDEFWCVTQKEQAAMAEARAELQARVEQLEATVMKLETEKLPFKLSGTESGRVSCENPNQANTGKAAAVSGHYTAVYGYCPTCLKETGEWVPGILREKKPNGNDQCRIGHTYPSRDSVVNTYAYYKSLDGGHITWTMYKEHAKLFKTSAEIEGLSAGLCAEVYGEGFVGRSITPMVPFKRRNAGAMTIDEVRATGEDDDQTNPAVT